MDYYKNADLIKGEGYLLDTALSGIKYQVIADLAVEPVTIEFFKQHAHIDFNTDDNLTVSYLKSARQYLERWSQLSFGVKEMRLTALKLPANYRLMFGPVDVVNGYDNLGDTMLNSPLKNVTIEYTTKWEPLPEAVKIAICKRAAGDYAIRENVILNDKANVQEARGLYDEAEKLMLSYRNVTFL